MDLAKYLNLLRTRSLYLPSLPAFEDPWEGATGVYNADLDLTAIPPFENRSPEADRAFIESNEYGGKMLRRTVYVSCWHANESESEAMWKLYGQTGGSIAVQTTIGHLESVGPSSPADGASGIYGVRYHDLSKLPIPEQDAYNFLARYAYKRPSYRHENEIRLIHHSMNHEAMSIGSDQLDLNLAPWGKSFSVDLDSFVQKVVVSPASPSWFKEVVEDSTEKYGFNFSVQGSEMNLRPTYGFLAHNRNLMPGGF